MSDKNAPSSPAATYQRHHPPVRNINVEFKTTSTFGQNVADRVTSLVGSWPFIITQSIFLVIWMATNAYLAWTFHAHRGHLNPWDAYPFILLNLVLSFQAAYTGPVVMMSQNRQNHRDRMVAEHDFEINQRAEEEIEVVLRELIHQDKLILDAIKRIEALHEALPIQEMAQKLNVVLHNGGEDGASSS